MSGIVGGWALGLYFLFLFRPAKTKMDGRLDSLIAAVYLVVVAIALH